MLLNTTARTALRAVVAIAKRGEDSPIRTEEIATDLGSPRNYLSKTLNQLARSGVLSSTRGPNGGFALATSATHLALSDVIAPFSAARKPECLLRNKECPQVDRCSAHQQWSLVVASLDNFLDQTTVAELVSNPDILQVGLSQNP